ncbi:MAG: hypothetical protein ACP5G4_09930, partial [bacterium]
LQGINENLPDYVPEQVLEQLVVANEMQADAYSALERGEKMLALHMTMQARETARRAESMISQLTPDGSEAPDGLLRLIEGNAELIEELSPVVDEYGGEVTRSNFSAAVDLQREAWTAFENEDYEVAGKFGRMVQDKLNQVRKAITMAESRNYSEQIAAELERTSEILVRAEEKVPEGAAESMDLLRTARDMFTESEALYSQGRSSEASRMLQEVAVIVQRAVKLSEKRSLRSAELIETICRTDDYLDVARGRVEESGLGNAQDILERADDVQISAKHALNNAENAKAEKLTLEARRLADLAIRTSHEDDEIDLDKIEGAIAKTDDVISRYSFDIEQSGNASAIDLLRRAEHFQAESITLISQKKYREGLTMTRAALETVQRAARTAGIE